MSRQERELREKQQTENTQKRNLRRNQVIFAVFSAILIVSMIIQLVSW